MIKLIPKLILNLEFFIWNPVAAGLYYLAELVEEYASVACRTIRYIILVSRTDQNSVISQLCFLVMILICSDCAIFWWFKQTVIGIYVGFILFEDFPLYMNLFGIAGQVAHLYVMKSFPFFVITSPPIIGSVVLVVVNHYYALTHFSSHYYPFMEVSYYPYNTKLRCIASSKVQNNNCTVLGLGDGLLHSVLMDCSICVLHLTVSQWLCVADSGREPTAPWRRKRRG